MTRDGKRACHMTTDLTYWTSARCSGRVNSVGLPPVCFLC